MTMACRACTSGAEMDPGDAAGVCEATVAGAAFCCRLRCCARASSRPAKRNEPAVAAITIAAPRRRHAETWVIVLSSSVGHDDTRLRRFAGDVVENIVGFLHGRNR